MERNTKGLIPSVFQSKYREVTPVTIILGFLIGCCKTASFTYAGMVLGFTMGRRALMTTQAVAMIVGPAEILLRMRFDPYGRKPRQVVRSSGLHQVARTTSPAKIAGMNRGMHVILWENAMAAVTRKTLWPVPVGGLHSMAVDLLMALTAVHGSAARCMLMTIVLDALMAVLTRHRLAAVHGCLEFLNRDAESTPTPAL